MNKTPQVPALKGMTPLGLVDYTQQDVGYDQRHGGAYDRGSADAYYGRIWEPHYYRGATYSTERVDMADMTAEEITAYTAGYNNTHERKDWGYEG